MKRLTDIHFITTVFLVYSVLFVVPQRALAQSSAFTYQGQLSDSGVRPSGSYDFQLRLFDALISGVQVGPSVVFDNATVTNGVFTVQPDFGPVFPGADRFLEIAVRPGASTGAYTTLAPLQPIMSTPYALRSLKSGAADALTPACAGCVGNANIADGNITNVKISDVAGGKITGSIPVSAVPSGSTSYIQNGTSPQVNANFNIGGNATAGAFNYTVPQSSVYVVNEAAFSSRDGTGVQKGLGLGGASPIASTITGLLAPINLPDGATITNVRYVYVDNSSNNLSLRVLKNFNGGAYSIFGSHSSAVATSTTQIVDVPVSELVDNSNFSIEVQANPTTAWGDSTMQMRSVILTYTMPRPAR